MFCCKELKLLYATIVLLLKVELLVSTVMENSSLFAPNSDELRSLEVCTARNQQKLGSVFGNFTRHHKKGHRRRSTTTTSSTQTTIVYTTTIENEDKTTELQTTTEYIATTRSTYPHLPKALRLSSTVLDPDYEDFNVDNIIAHEVNELMNRERHKNRHHERDKEVIEELDETSLTKSRNKVKKMYRDSAGSSVNKLSEKGVKGGIFLTDNCTTVLAQIGTTAILHCEVSDITENTVTWIRKKDYSLLSVGLVTYSADSRFFSAHGRHVKDWALHIRFATPSDAGYYECQVPTHPPTSIFFKLVLVAAYAEIVGESEKIIHEGSMLRLICIVKRSTEPPSYVFWYFENRMINYDLNGVSVHNGRQTSELVIGKAQPRHAGNYTCVPANAKAASVTVHVVQTAYAEIVGESEKIIHEGSMLRLICIVKRSTEPPSYVFWYFENRMINYDLNGVSVHNGRQTSELVIGKAQPRHAGNYTCVPANAKAASVTVHVVQSETPAAMQHGNNSAASKEEIQFFLQLFVTILAISKLTTEYYEFG